ncbi:MAG: hypothetical protein ACK52W_03250, partial [Alphaproteobacteria bacterium]
MRVDSGLLTLALTGCFAVQNACWRFANHSATCPLYSPGALGVRVDSGLLTLALTGCFAVQNACW